LGTLAIATVIRVIIVDRLPTMRVGLRVILSQEEIEVVGEIGDGNGALRLVQELRPDLVILGLNLPGRPDGVRTCQLIKEVSNAPYVLIHTDYDFAEGISPCAAAGADSYLHKSTDSEDLLDAVYRTAAGEPVWEVGRHIREERSVRGTTLEGNRLSPKEMEVLALKIHRRSNAEIAEKLSVSIHTVKHHVTSIHKKLGMKSLKRFH
jgi:two-component system, NarL family, response regulator LiaR